MEERRMPMEMILMRTYDEEINGARNAFLLNILAILAIIFGTFSMMALEGWDFNMVLLLGLPDRHHCGLR